MKRVLLLASVLVVILLACPTPTTETKNLVTGVTITGTGITGTGENKEITISVGQEVDLGVTITKTGTPDVTESWLSADTETVGVDQTTGVISGIKADNEGVVVTVTVGGKSDSILVKVEAAIPGLTLEFDTDKLEFQTIATTVAEPTVPTIVKDASNIITLTNVDGTFKQNDTFQGSSYLLLKTALEGDFEIKAAVKMTTATGTSDKYSTGVGMFTTDEEGQVTLDLRAAVMAKQSHSSPRLRSLYGKSKTTTDPEGALEAGNPNIGLTNAEMGQYHILSVKRLGGTVTFKANGMSSDVDIAEVVGGTDPTEIYPALAGPVKVGLYAAGVTAVVEGLTINELNTDGSVKTELYSSGTLPIVANVVTGITLTGPDGSENSATVDMAGSTEKTIQLSVGYIPVTATIGKTVSYTVSEGDDNVTISENGLVTITAVGDGEAKITATSGIGTGGTAKTASYTITIIDSSVTEVESITIPETLSIAVEQSLTLQAVVLPATAENKAVTWTSTNSAILVSDEGVVTVAEGTATGTTATITATSVAKPAVVSNECTVTVIALSETWTEQQCDLFGSSGSAPTGSASVNSATALTMTVTGGNVNSSNRRFYYAYKPVTGDFIFTARVASITGTFLLNKNNAYRYGLLYTETLDTVSAYTELGRFAENGFYTLSPTPTYQGSRAYKLDVGTGSTQSRSDYSDATVGNYLRIARTGDRFTLSMSTDGEDWSTLNTSSFIDDHGNGIPSAGYIGFFAAPGTEALTFAFDNISIE